MNPAITPWLLGLAGPLIGLLISLYVKDAAIKAVKAGMSSAFAEFKMELLEELDKTYVRGSICSLKMENTHDRIDVGAKRMDSQEEHLRQVSNRFNKQQHSGV